MEKTTVLKKVIAVFLLCVYCALPLLGVAAPTFPNTYNVPQSTRDAYKCWSTPTWVKTGSPSLRNLQGNHGYFFYSTTLHKSEWAQTYKCPRQGCCNGRYTITRWEYSNHTRSRKVSSKSSGGYTTTTYYCATCNHNFPVVTKNK